MRYHSQSVAYWYFAVAMALFGLQIVFGLLSAAKYLGPDPLLYILPFDVTKVIHTNLLVVWVLTGFMGATYWMVPDESRTELHSVKLAYIQLGLWVLMGVTAVIGYLFRYGTGNKLLEQPLPHKIVIVVVMLMFLYNVVMTIRKSGRFTTTEGVLLLGIAGAAVLYLPALIEHDNYVVSIFYRWWTIHLWVEGVWEMIQGGFLAYLLIRLSGADREVLEKWLYVIVGLVSLPASWARRTITTGWACPATGCPSGASSARWSPRPWSAWRSTPTRPCGGRAWPTPTRWPCTGRWAAPSSRCSARGCSAWRTPGPASTSGRTAR